MAAKTKLSPLTSLIKYSSKQEADQAKLARQQDLLKTVQTSQQQYQHIIDNFTPEKLEKVLTTLEQFKYGSNIAAPIICMGPSKCPFYHACPLGNGYSYDPIKGKIALYDSLNDFPIGKQCIIERVFIEQKLLDYIQEFDVDPAKTSELSLINDLALLDLYKNRAILLMAGGDKSGEGTDFLSIDVGYSEQGAKISESVKEHPLFTIIDKLEKRRMKVLEELLATRKIRAAAASKFGTMNQSSQLMVEIEKIRKAIESKSSKVIDVELQAQDLVEDTLGTSLDLDDDLLKID